MKPMIQNYIHNNYYKLHFCGPNNSFNIILCRFHSATSCNVPFSPLPFILYSRRKKTFATE